MAFDLNRLLGQAEGFLRRHLKPRHVVAAERRRTKRKIASVMRRVRNGAGALGVSGAGTLTYVAIAPVSTTGLIAAGAAAMVATGTAVLWPRRSPLDKISREELTALLLEAEDWLLQQRPSIPGRAMPVFDEILFRLGDLHPHVSAIDPHGLLAWDLRRVLTQHLPRLVQSYTSLTETVRREDKDLLPRFVEGLETVDDELVRICREANEEHLHSFDVQEQFLESRYRDPRLGQD